jgi:2-polyprenyl-6-methoxyphenol hydroxylase-like FAD-dependent oxidoreductase
MTTTDLDIAIVGAGPAGLLTALRLHREGFRPTVYEVVPELKPLGVGVDIKTVGTAEIDDLGLLEEFRAISVDAEDSIFYNHFGQEIYAEKCGVHMGYLHEQRFVHRGTLQMLFHKAALERLGADAFHLGAGVTGYSQDETGVTLDLRHADGRTEQVRHQAVIAADGIKSAVRRQMFPGLAQPHFSGITMWRGTTVMEPFRNGHTILHIGDPNIASMIVYPIADDFEGSGKTLVNWVAETNGEETIEDWNQIGDISEVIPLFDTVDLVPASLVSSPLVSATQFTSVLPLPSKSSTCGG